MSSIKPSISRNEFLFSVYVFLLKVYVFLLLSMYSYCSSMYSYRCLCILIVVYVFLDAATLTEDFPCFFLGCKANARVQLAKTGHGPHSQIVVLFYVLIVFYRSMYCLCVNVYYCHQVTTQLQLTNILYHIVFLTRLKIKKENRLEKKICRKGWREEHKESSMWNFWQKKEIVILSLKP
jgi:hypothetical protein